MDKKIFNEDSLGEEIKKQWGEFGAHYEVYQMLLKALKATEKSEYTEWAGQRQIMHDKIETLQQELKRVNLSKSLLAFELKTLQGFHTELYNKVEADETIEPITKYVSPEDLDELTNNQ